MFISKDSRGFRRSLLSDEKSAVKRKREPVDAENLMAQHGKLVYAALRRYFPHKSRDEDYIQIGNIGLWKAADTFQDGLGSFSTYAYSCILRELIAQDRQDNRSKRKSAFTEQSLSEMTANVCQPALNFEDRLISRFRTEEILRRIRRENPRQAYVLSQRMQGRSNVEIAREMNVSRQRIYQICLKAGRYLKED